MSKFRLSLKLTGMQNTTPKENLPSPQQSRFTLGKNINLHQSIIYMASKEDRKREADEILKKFKGEEDFEKCGMLYKRGGGRFGVAFKHRYFILRYSQENKKMYYYRVIGPEWEQRQAKGYIDLKLIKEVIDDPPGERHEFHLVAEDRTWILRAETREEKLKWLEYIKPIVSGDYNPEEAGLHGDRAVRLRWTDFQIEAEPITRGATGKVCRAVWDQMVPVAIKFLNQAEQLERSDRLAFNKEIETLSKLTHPNIVQMYGYISNGPQIGLVTEFVKGGDLTRYIFDAPPLTEISKISLCLSISRAVHYIHGQNFIHCDLKPQNILVEDIKEASIKLCDFGLTILHRDSSNPNNQGGVVGTIAYSAPELPGLVTNKIDVFSFGIIMFEISTQQRAWNNMSSWDITATKEKNGRPVIPPNCAIKELIEKSWAQKPEDRPSFRDLYAKLEQKKLELLLSTMSIPSHGNSSPEEKILQAFGSKDVIDWDVFLSVACATFNVRIGEFENMRWVLGQGGNISKENWTRLISWFEPLVLNEDYLHGREGAETVSATQGNGFTISDIVDVVKPTWFFGFITAEQARKILLKKPPGSYLVRFSGEKEKFVLSVAHSVKVINLRITRENRARGVNIYTMQEKTFNSLAAILDNYKDRPLHSDVPTEGYVNLTNPCNRNTDLKLLNS